MKDPRLVTLKLRAEKDKNLSDGACRSLALIVSNRYVNREPADAEFRLAWSDLSRLHPCRLSRPTAERRIQEITSCGYLKREVLKGCPAAWWYVFVFRCTKNDATDRVRNGASGCNRNAAHHISNSFQDKIKQKRSVSAAASAKAAAPTQKQALDPAVIQKGMAALRAVRGEILKESL
jgi:hypothetical protein